MLTEQRKGSLAAQLVQAVDWSSVQEASGSSETVGHALLSLALAEDSRDASRVYWSLENHIVVQGSLYPAALPAVPVLLALLAGDHIRPSKISALQLLYLIHNSERAEEAFSHDLADQCRAHMERAVWLLAYLHQQEGLAGARELLELICDGAYLHLAPEAAEL